MSYPKNLLDQLIPYGIFDLDFACIVRTVFLDFDFAYLVVCSFELAVAVRYRMAVFNAIFKYADMEVPSSNFLRLLSYLENNDTGWITG